MATEKGAWDPGPKYRAYLNKIAEVLDDGAQRTVRDVYYALEARGFESELRQRSYRHAEEQFHQNPDSKPHPNEIHESEWRWEFEYRYVKRAVKRGRRAGIINPAQIVDASRSAENRQRSGWRDPEHFVRDRVEDVWEDYWENFWEEQPTYVEVWLEKQSLASVFDPICRRHNVRLEATRGDWSDSKVYEACQRLLKKLNEGKDVRILYFGDFNPSGFHAPVSILDAMGYYGIGIPREFPESDDTRYYDAEHGSPFPSEGGGSFALERKALNTEHIEEFELPENPVPSSSDKDATIKEHFRRFVSDGRDTNVELNALKEFEREYLEGLVEESIEEHIDDDARQEVQQRYEDHREQLADCIQIDRSVLEGGEDSG